MCGSYFYVAFINMNSEHFYCTKLVLFAADLKCRCLACNLFCNCYSVYVMVVIIVFGCILVQKKLWCASMEARTALYCFISLMQFSKSE